MAKTDWTLTDTVKPDDFNNIGREINQLRTDVDHIEVPAASLTEAGIVQLSSSANSSSETLAATPRAVKTAYDAAAAAQATANAAETPTGAQAKVNAAVGNLASLQTTAKGNAVAAINELFTSASNGKTQIAAAITGKGVPATGSDTFPVLAQKIGQIVTGKRFASGEITGVTGFPAKFNVGGLLFKPSYVLIKIEAGTPHYVIQLAAESDFNFLYGMEGISGVAWRNRSPGVITTDTTSNLWGVITQDGFSISISLSSSHPINGYWRAYE